MQPAIERDERKVLEAQAPGAPPADSLQPDQITLVPAAPKTGAILQSDARPTSLPGISTWPVPSELDPDPDVARVRIALPEFDALQLEKARVIAGRFPLAEAEYRAMRTSGGAVPALEVPHFERVFRIASAMASVAIDPAASDYDSLLVLAAWYAVRPGQEGFLGSYPKALLCPLSHGAPPTALSSLSTRQRNTFERRVPIYLRCLLQEKFGLRSCADIENADLRHLLRSTGFRLIRPSAVPEVAFPGITAGADPAVRPWKLTLRQELSDERAAELLITAALWQVQYGRRLVVIEAGVPRWNIGAFARTDWEDAFLSLGVRVPPALMRESGLFDWRLVLQRCLQELGTGNLPPEVLGKISAWPQRICHDSGQAIWEGLDHIARTVMERVRITEPLLFRDGERLDYKSARSFRGWVRLFDEVSPQILSRLGVSAFTALRRVAPEYFGWGSGQLKPWELEQEHGKWKGPRGQALLRSAYAFALYECGLGSLDGQDDHITWQCTLSQLSSWYTAMTVERNLTPYELLYGLASRHGLTPLLNRELTHTAVISLLAHVNVHQNLPKIEGCWELCMRMAIEHHGGKLEVRLVLPDLVPLPLRLRKAVLAPLTYRYLHSELRFIRDFDLRMVRETRRKLEEIPGWWDDERVVGTPLADRLADPADPARGILTRLRPDPWLEPPAQKIRFRALYLLISKRALAGSWPDTTALASEEVRALLRLTLEATLAHTNLMHVSRPAVIRGFERLLAREDTLEMLDSLLLHIGTAYETEVWSKVRKFVVLDVINDLVALTVRSSLLHLMSSD